MAGTKRVRDMSYRAHEKLFMALRPDAPGRDWRTLAEHMGYTYAQISQHFEYEPHPVKALINHWESSNPTISELMDFLAQMERKDLLEDLQPFIEETPTPEEAQQKSKETRCFIESSSDTTMAQNYDAFLIYAPEDHPFAEEVVAKLEGPPYNLKICTEHRDVVPGGCMFEKYAQIIESKCKKILLILSENFTQLQDGQPIFQAKLALNLSPGAKERCLIPILYQPCKVPSIYGHITHLDYTREDARRFFWDRLSRALMNKSEAQSTSASSISQMESTNGSSQSVAQSESKKNSKRSEGKKV